MKIVMGSFIIQYERDIVKRLIPANVLNEKPANPSWTRVSEFVK